MMTQDKHPTLWTAGNAASWLVGILAGAVVGIALLVTLPHTVNNPQVETKPSAQEKTHKETHSDNGTAKETEHTATVNEHTPEKVTEVASATANEQGIAPADGGNHDKDPAAETAHSETAAAPAGDATAGQAKYAATCAGCHGANAEGGVGTALAITKDWTDEQFTAAVREGKAPTRTLSPVMPHFNEDAVSADDVANIHAYLKTLH